MRYNLHNLDQLRGNTFDILIVGGGVVGVSCAIEARKRGYSVCLVEKSDFGGATSSGCFKIAHSGVRYLQKFDFSSLLRSAKDHNFLLKNFPHTVKPLPFLLFGEYKKLLRHPYLLHAGFCLYDLLAGRYFTKDLKSHKFISSKEIFSDYPELQILSPSSGVMFWDAQFYNCERNVLTLAKTASEAGAALSNYAELKKITFDHSQNFYDAEVNDGVALKARMLINAAGPWRSRINSMLGIKQVAQEHNWSKGIQLVVPKISDVAFAVESSEEIVIKGKRSSVGRSYFFAPWRGMTLVGTSDEIVKEEPDSFKITHEEILRFKKQVNKALGKDLIKKVHWAWGGLRPIDKQADGGEISSMEDRVIEYDTPLVEAECSKYTTFNSLSKQILDAVQKKLSPSEKPVKINYVGGGQVLLDDFFDEEVKNYLISSYGSEAEEILKIAKDNKSSNLKLIGPVTLAELIFCVTYEATFSLKDFVFSRTNIGFLGEIDDEKLRLLADHMGQMLSWDEAKKLNEISQVKNKYKRLTK